MSRSLRCSVPALVLLTFAACTDAPLGTTTDGTDTSAPLFLIGQSPLIRLDPSVQGVEVTAEVTRGFTEVKVEDKFRVRLKVTFTLDGSSAGEVAPPGPIDLIGVKDDGVRQGDKVAIAICINIPAPLWDAIVTAGTAEATATVELFMTDGAGKEHTLDHVEHTSNVSIGGNL